MKKRIFALFLSLTLLCGCSQETSQDTVETDTPTISEPSETITTQQAEQGLQEQVLELPKGDETVDFDLTVMSETVVFAQVYDLLMNPASYEEKTFKIQGEYEFYTIPNSTEIIYFIVINDALGCCPQGIEIRFEDEIPPEFCAATIKATAHTEVEGEYTYIHLMVSEFLED